jgi:membrane-associated phospholipid phosphatase
MRITGQPARELVTVPVLRRIGACRQSETVLIAYFAYMAMLAIAFPVPPSRRLFAAIVPLSLLALAWAETRKSRPWSRVTRDWAPLGFVLLGYWQLDWFTAPPLTRLHETLVRWDRIILENWGLRQAVEAFGPLIPWTLELCYLLLYTIPPICVASLYLLRRRARVEQFLATFLLGAFTAYALLPHFPSVSPYIAFSHSDLPGIYTSIRGVNLFVLSNLDIATSVFPSGHVAVAFSAGFGLLAALPERKWLSSLVFLAAALVFVATVYGRYHYAADGVASILISIAAWRVSTIYDRRS